MTAREEMLKRLRPRVKKINTESLGEIHVKQVPVETIMRLLESVDTNTADNSLTAGMSRVRASVAITLQAVCDERGNLLFTEDDREAIGYMALPDLDLIANEVAKMSKMTDDGIDELAGN